MDSPSQFRKTTLPNGVRIITETIPSVRSISVGAWIETGSRDESASESGISHFIEHMVFKGTARRRMHHIAQRLESVGGYLNAFTTKEFTCYFARALDEHLGRAIDTVLDLILEPHFPAREIEKEKDVVLEEMKMYDDTPEDLVFIRFEEEIYRGHPMAAPIIGTPESVTGFTRDQLFDFLDQHYTPNRLVLTVAGNVDHDAAVRYAKKVMSRTSRAAKPRERTPVGAYTPAEFVEKRPIQQAHLILGTRGYSATDDRRTALSILNTILGGGMSSRLNQNIREKYGFCYSIYSFANLHSDTGDFGIYMGTDPSRIQRSKKLIFRELEKLADKPVSKRTLNQAMNQVKGSIMLGLENMSNRMMRLGRQEMYFEQNFTLDQIVAQIESVTEEDLLQLSRELFKPDQYTTVVLEPA